MPDIAPMFNLHCLVYASVKPSWKYATKNTPPEHVITLVDEAGKAIASFDAGPPEERK